METVINPHAILEEIRLLFIPKAEVKNIDFKFEIDESLPKAIVADGVRLRQVIMNLISNAIKFTEDGEIHVCINVNEKREGRCDLLITVTDTGIGIDKDQQNFIFNAFNQQNRQDPGQYEGTGMGLAITRKLVEMMNGRIYLKSDPGIGSTFKVIFQDILIPDEKNDEEHSGIKTETEFQNAVILNVDDNSNNRMLINGFLEDYRLKIIDAENGKDAIEKAGKFYPDLILMDMKMPIMDGYEATRTMKQDENLKRIPIIAVSAAATQEEEERCLKTGCDAFLMKPIGKSDLLDVLRRYVK